MKSGFEVIGGWSQSGCTCRKWGFVIADYDAQGHALYSLVASCSCRCLLLMDAVVKFAIRSISQAASAESQKQFAYLRCLLRQFSDIHIYGSDTAKAVPSKSRWDRSPARHVCFGAKRAARARRTPGNGLTWDGRLLLVSSSALFSVLQVPPTNQPLIFSRPNLCLLLFFVFLSYWLASGRARQLHHKYAVTIDTHSPYFQHDWRHSFSQSRRSQLQRTRRSAAKSSCESLVAFPHHFSF